MNPSRPAPRWAGRVASILAVGSAGAHLVSLAGYGGAQVVVMAAMALGCLYCARHLWSRAAVRDWALVAAMSVGMIAAHQSLGMGGGHRSHQGGAPSVAATMPMSPVPLILAALEAVFATTMLFLLTRSSGADDVRLLRPVAQNR